MNVLCLTLSGAARCSDTPVLVAEATDDAGDTSRLSPGRFMTAELGFFCVDGRSVRTQLKPRPHPRPLLCTVGVLRLTPVARGPPRAFQSRGSSHRISQRATSPPVWLEASGTNRLPAWRAVSSGADIFKVPLDASAENDLVAGTEVCAWSHTTALVFTLAEDPTCVAEDKRVFEAVLVHDLARAARSEERRFRIAGILAAAGNVLACIHICEADPTRMSSRAIADELLVQAARCDSALRCAPSMENFMHITLYDRLPTWVRRGEGSLSQSLPPLHSKLEEAISALYRPVGGASVYSGGSIASGSCEVEMLTPVSARSAHMSAVGTHDFDGAAGRQAALSRLIEEAIAVNATEYVRQGLHLRHTYFRAAALLCIIITAALLLGSQPTAEPWHWLVWISVSMTGLAPWAHSHRAYFIGAGPSPFLWLRSLLRWRVLPEPPENPLWALSLSTFVSLTLGNSLTESALLGSGSCPLHPSPSGMPFSDARCAGLLADTNWDPWRRSRARFPTARW